MIHRAVLTVALILLPALYAARIDHRSTITARAARGIGAAEGRAWVIPAAAQTPGSNGI